VTEKPVGDTRNKHFICRSHLTGQTQLLDRSQSVLQPLNVRVVNIAFPDLTLIDPASPQRPRPQSFFFAGFSHHRVNENLTAEVNALAPMYPLYQPTDMSTRDSPTPVRPFTTPPAEQRISLRGILNYNRSAGCVRLSHRSRHTPCQRPNTGLAIARIRGRINPSAPTLDKNQSDPPRPAISLYCFSPEIFFFFFFFHEPVANLGRIDRPAPLFRAVQPQCRSPGGGNVDVRSAPQLSFIRLLESSARLHRIRTSQPSFSFSVING